MKISRIIFFFNFLEKIREIFLQYTVCKKVNFEMFFRKEFFSVNFFRNKIFLGPLFRNFSFHEKICFDFELFFFSTEIILQNFNFFRKKC